MAGQAGHDCIGAKHARFADNGNKRRDIIIIRFENNIIRFTNLPQEPTIENGNFVAKTDMKVNYFRRAHNFNICL